MTMKFDHNFFFSILSQILTRLAQQATKKIHKIAKDFMVTMNCVGDKTKIWWKLNLLLSIHWFLYYLLLHTVDQIDL
jgi:hypothetical protein